MALFYNNSCEQKNLKKVLLGKILRIFDFLLVFLLVPASAFAQTDLREPQQVLGTIVKIGNLMGQFLMAISVIVILYAGFQYMTAGGNEEKVSDATKTLTYAIVGIVVGLLAFSVGPILTGFFQ